MCELLYKDGAQQHILKSKTVQLTAVSRVIMRESMKLLIWRLDVILLCAFKIEVENRVQQIICTIIYILGLFNYKLGQI